jgi:NADH:ubiquinone oxidoreductase subunit 2 (subunit N)
MLLFVGLIRFRKGGIEVARIKYFIVQRIGSTVFLSRVAIIAALGSTLSLETLIGLGLFLKLGAAPLHGWFVRVIGDIS